MDDPLFVWTQAQLDDTAVRLAAQEAALRGAQQRQQLASLRAQLNALQHAPISSPGTLPAKDASSSPTHDAGVDAVLLAEMSMSSEHGPLCAVE